MVQIKARIAAIAGIRAKVRNVRLRDFMGKADVP